jgi:Fur family transcriptional regulator, ferric uptake regulator
MKKEMTYEQFLKKIQEAFAGKRFTLTSQRETVLRIIYESDDHPDIDEIYLRSRAVDQKIGIATVYRTVSALVEVGVIEKLDFKDGKARYEEAATCQHHDHLIDVDTNEVLEFHNDEIEKLKQAIAKKMGYELVYHRLDLYGKKISK